MARQVDLDLGREAYAQRMGGEFARIERDAHGQALDYLDQLPVAFCAGISASDDPVPPEKPTTLP